MNKAYEMPRTAITIVPTADFSEKRHTFATISSAGALATTEAGAKAIGVLQTPGISGEPCNVMTEGVSFIIVGATLVPGQEVESDATGKAIPLATGKSNGICLVGGTAGSIGCILVK